MNSNIRTLNDYRNDSYNSTRLDSLRAAIQNRLDQGDYRLPFLPNSEDHLQIVHLNNILNEDTIKMIMEAIVSKNFNNQILTLILQNLPTEFLQDYLDLRSERNRNFYTQFTNLLLYAGLGVGDLDISHDLLNNLISLMLSDSDLESIDVSRVSEVLEGEAAEIQNNNNERNGNFRSNVNSVLTNINWRRIVQSATLYSFGLGGLMLAQPVLTPLLTTLGTAYTTSAVSAAANQIVLSSQLASTTSNVITSEDLLKSLTSTLTLFKNYFFN